MTNRSYTGVTIKTLFGQARTCAWPDCEQPLIFEDRRATTVVAEIAHIRSEVAAGPRHDPTFTGNIDGPENLLLLCGVHHKPVDRQASIYSIAELEAWKAAQRAGAGAGTIISDADAKAFSGLTPQEQAAITDLARLTTRVENACLRVLDAFNQVDAKRQESIRQLRRSWGPVVGLDENGNPMAPDGTEQIRLSVVQERELQAEAHALAARHRPAVTSAIDALAEEVAVLQMVNPLLGGPARAVLLTAQGAGLHASAEDPLNTSIAAMKNALRALWLTANPES